MHDVASRCSRVVANRVGRWLPVPALALLVLAPAPAMAQPTVWDVARDPGLRRVEEQTLVAERLLLRPIASPGELVRARLAFGRLLTEIAANPPSTGTSARLDALVGALYSEPHVADYTAARSWLTRALDAAPPAPLAQRVHFLLGVACAKLGDGGCDREAYTEVLELATAPNDRAQALMNRAEGRMLAGDLAGAIVDYRQARYLASVPELVSLVYYGLGVALERSGDLPSALRAMLEARAAWTSSAPYSPLDDPDVFFVPAFDLYYYKGLEALAVARAAKADRDWAAATRDYARAAGYFDQYLAEAEREDTPWVRNARALLGASRLEPARIPAAIER